MAVGDSTFFRPLLSAPGLNVFGASAERLLDWGAGSSLFVFPMATSCCGIEFMATAAARVDLDRMGSIVRGTPRHCDVMVVAGTITVKMAPRVKKLWEQMPEPKWCIAMGSCAISGDFYREIYSVVQGVDTVVPVDIYVPGCPPNPEALMDALLMLKARILAKKTGGTPEAPEPPQPAQERPHVRSVGDPERDPAISEQQTLLAGQPELEVEAKDVPLPIFQPAAQAESGFFDSLVAEFGGETAKDAPPIIDRSKHLAFARRLLGNGYRQLAFIVGSHWLPGKPIAEECYEVAYGLRACGPKSHVAQWRVRTLVADPIDSLTPLVAGANWAEREQFDLVGVRFAGHPDLRRLMLPEAWEGHPLRRDYAINTRCAPWR